MAFGIKKSELMEWKRKIDQGEIAFLTHYWLDERFKECKTVTKVGCSDVDKLIKWGEKYGLQKEWIDYRQKGYSHFDLLGERQRLILEEEGLLDHLSRFKL
ncbi:hypothetical protein JOC78_002203 [Bacillus ectoiniformans]|uniref:hypothetical protein n=1 Tax=Bacillus ectoiniformans TaxID=1494429 RepID=UPI00195BD05B|nr:hypothetical protein [Bacillus ectoiniformans]MBM7649250.1 hypothetical protein [Bacillus ectoiniformans]